MYRLSEVPHAHLLEDADDSLAKLYNQLLRFVERDVCAVMNAAEKVSGNDTITRTPTIMTTASSDGIVASPITATDDHAGEQEGRPKFDIMANVVWDELGRTIMDEIGSIVFASGKPNEFRKVCPAFSTGQIGRNVLKQGNNSTMKLRRASFGLWNFSRRRYKRLRACIGIRRILHLNDGGSFLCTSSCGGKRL